MTTDGLISGPAADFGPVTTTPEQRPFPQTSGTSGLTGMSDDDPRHGTTRGYYAGCREACCRKAIARYEKAGRLAKLRGGRAVPAVGAQRRIQALMRLGWTAQDIAMEAGFAHRNGVHRILAGQKGKPCRYILLDTFRTISETYERMAMRLPEPSPYRTRARKMAERNDWPPPLAWDDIDDPDAEPYRAPKHDGPGRPNRRLNHVENAEWMADNDESLTGACARLGIQPESLRVACKRAGRLDVFDRLANRELNAPVRMDMRAMKRAAS